MAYFKREGGGNRGGFRPGGNKGYKGSFGGGQRRDARPTTMHSATCASCGKPCEVPFRPTGDKPVYCRDCFAGRAAMGGDRSSRPDPRSSGSNQASSHFYTAQSGTGPQTSGGNEELKKQLEGVNAKLERLISAIQTLSHALVIANDEPREEHKEISSKKTTAPSPRKISPAKTEEKAATKKTSKKK